MRGFSCQPTSTWRALISTEVSCLCKRTWLACIAWHIQAQAVPASLWALMALPTCHGGELPLQKARHLRLTCGRMLALQQQLEDPTWCQTYQLLQGPCTRPEQTACNARPCPAMVHTHTGLLSESAPQLPGSSSARGGCEAVHALAAMQAGSKAAC